MKISKLVDRVQDVLNDDDKARDNDYRLECIIYSKYFNLSEISVLDFYFKLNNNFKLW